MWHIAESVFWLQKKKASGKIQLEVKHKGKCHQENSFVVEDNEQTILSGDLCKKLGLVQRIAKLEEHPEFYGVAEPYVDVFKGFGNLKGVTDNIKLKAGMDGNVRQARKMPSHCKIG